MTKTFRNVCILLATATVVAVLGFLLNRGAEEGSTGGVAGAPHRPDLPGETAHPSRNHGTKPSSPEDKESRPPGKPKPRPGPEELTRRRLESHRIAQVEKIQKLKAAGFGERHPGMVEATEKLRSIEAELTGTTGGDN